MSENYTKERNRHTERKPNRLDRYDYSSCGGYFVTICTALRQNYFWSNETLTSVGATIGRPPDVVLTPYGNIVERAIRRIPLIYPALRVEHYVIMPDHVHLLLRVCADEQGRPMVAPTISRVIQQLKGVITKQIGRPIWQKLFFDHVIRNEKDYVEHVNYIYYNPIKWIEERLKGEVYRYGA